MTMTGKNIAYYAEIYDTREDYKRELSKLYDNINKYLTFQPSTMLDYGCGRGNLTTYFEKEYGAKTAKYDPAIPEFSQSPVGKFDLVTNTDVLEHIPENELDDLISKIASHGPNAFFAIHLAPAKEILSNGENAHCTLKPPEWWEDKIKKHYGKAYLVPSLYEKTCCVVTWKPRLIDRLKSNIAPYKDTDFFQKIRMKLKMGFRVVKAWFMLPFRIEKSFSQLNTRLERLQEQNEQNYRDLVNFAIEKNKITIKDKVKVVTDNPVAYDSQDHLQPFGTIRDNTRNLAFFNKCKSLYPNASLLDLGCSGGGLVFDFLINDHFAVGIEGSDRSQKSGRANWNTIPENLFTADITKPFDVVDEKLGAPKKFNIISCWEVLEHIHRQDIPALFDNVKKHLADGGIFVGSVSKMTDDPLHVAVFPNEEWYEIFKENNLEVSFGYNDVLEFHEFCRGTGLSAFDTHNYQSDPQKGFHFVARLESA